MKRIAWAVAAVALAAATMVGGASGAGATVAVERLVGADRFATAIAVSQRAWAEGAATVVLVGGADHRDALAAAGLAGRLGGAPVLLTPVDQLREDVAAEIQRLGAPDVVLVGGPDAIGTSVEDAVAGLVSDVRRIAGDTAAETAAAVATDDGGLPESASGRVFLVHPGDANSGVLAGALAAARGAPVLLAETDALPDVTRAALDALEPAETLVLGGPAISDAVVAEVPNGRRVGGPDAYDLGVELADLGATWGLDPKQAVLAHGWADGVVAASLAGHLGVPLLLTDTHIWHGRLVDWFTRAVPVTTTIVGGEEVIDAFIASGVADGGGPIERRRGDRGAVVATLQQRLLDTGFNPGPVNGVFDEHTQFAMWALEKSFGLPVIGVAYGGELAHLQAHERPPVMRPDITAAYGDHVEISLRKQLMQVVKNGEVVASVHTSTGKASTPTIRGVFRIRDHRPGTNALGMYKSMHFIRGFAIHGYPSVPLYPASHGCARVYNRDADLLFSIVPDGMTVVTWL